MTRKTLLVYSIDKFEDFYEKYSPNYEIISISSFLNTSMQFEEDYFIYKKSFIDITSLLKFALARADVTLFYEAIINHLFREDDVEIIVEHNYVESGLNLFPEYFSGKRYLTDIEIDSDKDISSDEIEDDNKRNITVYNKDNFSRLLLSKKNENVDVISITNIINQDYFFFYVIDKKKIDNTKRYAVDISSMIRLINIRNDFIASFEAILTELARLKNIEFIIDTDFKDTCKELLKYNFEEYIEFEKDDNKIEADKKKEKSVVDLTDDELNKALVRFDNELFGHNDFKSDFKKQIKAFSILNKMGVRKVLSIFMCGSSGIGKTEVARILHRNLYPNSKEIKINFGNYSGKGSLWSLIGSPKGYHGSERGGELTNKILHSNSKVILIDEFEKADESVFSFFYELLEDGKFTDLNEKEVNLNGYIIIFTSNLTEETIKDKIPETLFSRFNMRYEFTELTIKNKQDFIKFKLEQLIDKYNKTFNSQFNSYNKEIILNLNLEKLNNLRDINNELTNKFIELVQNRI